LKGGSEGVGGTKKPNQGGKGVPLKALLKGN